jgi:hypothetical protein
MDAAAAHLLTGCGRRRPGSDDLDASSHDFRDWCHAHQSRNSDARVVKPRRIGYTRNLRVSRPTERSATRYATTIGERSAKKSACRGCFRTRFESVSPADRPRLSRSGRSRRACQQGNYSATKRLVTEPRDEGRIAPGCGTASGRPDRRGTSMTLAPGSTRRTTAGRRPG